MSLVSVHYHELALKGGNRPRFQRILQRNLQQALKGTGTFSVRSVASRMLVESDGDPDEVLRRASRVCGVANAFPVRSFPKDLDKVGQAIAEELAARGFEGHRGFSGRVRIPTAARDHSSRPVQE